MRASRLIVLLAVVGIAGCASVSPIAVASPDAEASQASDPYQQQMQAMKDLHVRMHSARTAAEKRTLMKEHREVMQSAMDMMHRMREADGSSDQAPMDGMGMMPPSHQPHMERMRKKHADMERRMAMMEQMLQLMLDRETARP